MLTGNSLSENHAATLPGTLLPPRSSTTSASSRRDCARHAVSHIGLRPLLPSSGGITFKDYLLAGFGKKLADIFLIPQNEKTLAASLDHISANAVQRFFPPPDEQLIRSGIEAAPSRAEGYNATFWYPRRGGIEKLAEGLKNSLPELHLLEEVAAIDVVNKKAANNLRPQLGLGCAAIKHSAS